MVSFISTFPPIMCGIGTYTSYLVNNMPPDHWKVFSFKLDELESTDDILSSRERVSYEISLSHPQIPPSAKDEVLWFQHAFGMWGRESPAFTEMVNQAKRKKKKVIASFHTIHFESE
ncbi:MAG: hypothetical protein DRG25_06780, partial [Deltaproteobacteria bacterium]